MKKKTKEIILYSLKIPVIICACSKILEITKLTVLCIRIVKKKSLTRLNRNPVFVPFSRK